MRFSVIALLLAVALGLRASEFLTYQKDFNKEYSSAAEARYRLAVLEQNIKSIDEHNAQNLPWTEGINEFTDMTPMEFRYKFCGCAVDPKTRADRIMVFNYAAPDKVDWREKGAVTPVKNQGRCGSCWAFSVVGTVEGANYLQTGKLIDLSEQQLVDCAHENLNPKYQAHGCSGGWPWSVIDYVSDKGLCKQEDYPYTGKDDDCKDDKCTIAVRSKGKVMLPQQDEVSLANAIAKVPVSVVLDASAMQSYKSGIITKCTERINHAVLAVGYDEDAELQIKYWIIKNSWGNVWGEKGYCKIEKDVGKMGRCGITYSSVYPTF